MKKKKRNKKMKEELNKEQAKEDLLFIGNKIKTAANNLNEAYLRIKEILEGI